MTVKTITTQDAAKQAENMVKTKLSLKKEKVSTIELIGENVNVIILKNDLRVKAKKKGFHFETVGKIDLNLI